MGIAVILEGEHGRTATCVRCGGEIPSGRPYVRLDPVGQRFHCDCAAEIHGRPAIDQALTAAWSRRTSKHFDR